ncbi:MAG: 1-phosphofructokinase family hexose kinase [Clostridia bacterium]
MILAVSLNPCIDRTVTVENLSVGGHNEAVSSRCDVSGKGINVNVVLRQLSVPTACLGFEFDGAVVGDFLAKREIPFWSVHVPADIRVNLKVTDSARHVMTEINERGAGVPAQAVRAVLERLKELLKQTALLVVDGSVPPGVPSTIYADMIRMAKQAGVRTLLDASGALLREGVKAAPWLVKPNLFELETLFGDPITSREQVISLCRRLIEEGVEMVCLSMGKDGALLVTKDEVWHSPGLSIPVRGVQGAGDSMVAGLCMAMQAGLSTKEHLRYAMSCAHGSLLHEGTLLCTQGDFEAMLAQMPVTRLG